MAKAQVDKNSREYLERTLASGRQSLLLVLGFTIVNLVMVMLDSGTYFLFSASLPYYLTMYGKGIDNGFANGAWDVNGTYTITGLVVSAVVLGLFLLCWILSKKRSGWLVTALVLFAVDTLALLVFTFTIVTEPASNIMDFVFHAWVIGSLIQGIAAGRKLKKLDAQPQEYYGATPEF